MPFAPWMISLWVSQRARALAHAHGLTLHIASLVLAVLLFTYELLHLLFPGFPAFYLIASLLAASVLVSLLVATPLSVRTLSPDAYAEVMIAGRPEREVFFTLAVHIRSGCSSFLHVANRSRWLDDTILTKGPDAGGKLQTVAYQNEFRSRPGFAERHAQDIRHLIVNQYTALQRIEVMKRLAAQQLSIPRRRLCDYILQYNPTMHRHRVRKYLQNWMAITETVFTLQTQADVERLTRTIRDNGRIREDANRRITAQDLLIRYHDLHRDIHTLASTFSTSSSVLVYAHTLGRIAKECGSIPGSSKAQKAFCDRFVEEVYFLYKKQRAHPGIEPHVTLLKLCKRICPSIDAGAGAMPSTLKDVLEAIQEHNDRVPERKRSLSTSLRRRLREFTEQRPCTGPRA